MPKDFINSFEVYSNNNELLANINAVLLALLKAAAVPRDDLGSTPPSTNKYKKKLLLVYILIHFTYF